MNGFGFWYPFKVSYKENKQCHQETAEGKKKRKYEKLMLET